MRAERAHLGPGVCWTRAGHFSLCRSDVPVIDSEKSPSTGDEPLNRSRTDPRSRAAPQPTLSFEAALRTAELPPQGLHHGLDEPRSEG